MFSEKLLYVFNIVIKLKTMCEKREIDNFEQFLCLPLCFEKLLRQNTFASGKGLTSS